MEFVLANYVTLVFILLLLVLLYKYYLNYKKKLEGFPFVHLLPYFVYCHVAGKITEDTPVTNIFLEKLMQSGKENINEGLFMTFLSKPTLFIYSEEAIKFFVHEKAAMDKPSEHSVVEDIIGAGLIASNGERWRKHRKLINPAFNLGMLKLKMTLFNEHAMALVKDMEKLTEKSCVDILDTLKFHFFNSLCESVLGLKQGEVNKEEILKIAKHMDDLTTMTVKRVIYPWLRPKFLLNLFPSGRNFHQQNKECTDFVNKIISAMRKNISSSDNVSGEYFGNHFRKSFTYVLLNHHLNDPTFTFEDLHCEVKTILSAGFHTTTYSTLWCLYLLGLHPEIQEKVFNEIQSTVSDYVTYEESCNLMYLDAVIQESQRIYTTVPLPIRTLSEDVQFGKYKVFKGTTIAFFSPLLHRNPKVFSDPEQFRPERFLNGEITKTESFIPFFKGRRECIGKTYAIAQMKIVLSHILRNFKIISLDKQDDIRLSYALITSPTKPLRMKIMRRL